MSPRSLRVLASDGRLRRSPGPLPGAGRVFPHRGLGFTLRLPAFVPVNRRAGVTCHGAGAEPSTPACLSRPLRGVSGRLPGRARAQGIRLSDGAVFRCASSARQFIHSSSVVLAVARRRPRARLAGHGCRLAPRGHPGAESPSGDAGCERSQPPLT